jgi:hypothetical protein
MSEWWAQPPDFANSVYEEPDEVLAEELANAIRAFFRDRDDVDAFREVIDAVAASATAQRGRAPDGRPMLPIHVDEPGRSSDHATCLARELLDVLLPDRVRPMRFHPEIGAEHPLWTEYGELEWLEDPELGLSEDLRHALEAWAPEAAEDWERSDARLNEEGTRLFARVRAELPDRYTLVDDWRRD